MAPYLGRRTDGSLDTTGGGNGLFPERCGAPHAVHLANRGKPHTLACTPHPNRVGQREEGG